MGLNHQRILVTRVLSLTLIAAIFIGCGEGGNKEFEEVPNLPEAEIAAIASADNEVGDHFFNTTEGLPQVQLKGGATDKRGNLCTGYDADGTEVTVIGTTPTQVKDTSYIKNAAGIKGNAGGGVKVRVSHKPIAFSF